MMLDLMHKPAKYNNCLLLLLPITKRLNKVENNNANNQKNFDELKMMMQALLNRESNNVQINDNNKRLHEESHDENLS